MHVFSTNIFVMYSLEFDKTSSYLISHDGYNTTEEVKSL